MTEYEKLYEDIRTKVLITATISEDILIIDDALAPIKTLKQLSTNPSVLDESTFEIQTSEQLIGYLLRCAEALCLIKKNMKSRREQFEELDPVYEPDNVSDNSSPQFVSEVSEQIEDLKCKIDNFVTTKPAPLDFSKIDFTVPIAQAVAKAPQLKPSVPVNHEKQLKQSNEEQLRSNNLIIYNVAHDKTKPVSALEYAKDYFNSCGLTSYHLEQNKIVDAQFLSYSEDKSMCNLRVVMSNPWVVRALLSDAKKLKKTDSKLFRRSSFDFW